MFFVLAPVRVESFQNQINSKARANITLMACNLKFQQDLIRKRFLLINFVPEHNQSSLEARNRAQQRAECKLPTHVEAAPCDAVLGVQVVVAPEVLREVGVPADLDVLAQLR